MRELSRNKAAYDAMRATLEREHRGKVALLHAGSLVRVFDSRRDAWAAGMERFGEGGFSVKTIGERPASLGVAAAYTDPVPVA